MEQTQQILASAIVLDDGRVGFHVIDGEESECTEVDKVADRETDLDD
ncbi:hypothetical protein [Actinoplanes couchii]|uniref:Uncharacterized protein n=1 Tax=Actinoplanes couchii TaxID=403638 RepID=A0ABQ3XS63_9ACTN|nr:hypothetical protein [Actinoplanes couchii]MDR6317936.1 hypothetical protein [Actinoplanes couchii]GID61345.1 hypothetical protein Aco03nite_097490 [Actinoplanes couchii]